MHRSIQHINPSPTANYSNHQECLPSPGGSVEVHNEPLQRIFEVALVRREDGGELLVEFALLGRKMGRSAGWQGTEEQFQETQTKFEKWIKPRLTRPSASMY